MMRSLVRDCCAVCLVLLCAAPSEAGWGITDRDLVPRLRLRIEKVSFALQDGEAPCSLASLALRVSQDVPGPTLVLFLAGAESFSLGSVLPGRDTRELERLGEHLRARIEAAGPDVGERGAPGVVIVSHSGTRWEYTAWLVGACNAAGIEHVWLAARSSRDGEVGVLRARPLQEIAADPEAEPADGAKLVVVTVSRAGGDSWETAFTRIRVDAEAAFDLPVGWLGREAAPDPAPYDRVMARVRERIELQVAAARAASADASIKGEIVLPPPSGKRVPYEYVVQAIALLEEAGVGDIVIRCRVGPDTR